MPKKTGKQMCETIVEAKILEKRDGTSPTAEEIWNYSSTGELYMIFEWYQDAIAKLKYEKEDNIGVP